MFTTITTEQLKGKIERGEGFHLVETLPTTAFAHTHLPSAINLPPDKVTELAPTLLPDKKAEIIVYCKDID